MSVSDEVKVIYCVMWQMMTKSHVLSLPVRSVKLKILSTDSNLMQCVHQSLLDKTRLFQNRLSAYKVNPTIPCPEN